MQVQQDGLRKRCQEKVDDGTGLTRLVLEAIRTLCGLGEELVWEADGVQGRPGQQLKAKFHFATGLLLMNSGPLQCEVAHACDSSASRQSPCGTPISLGIITEHLPLLRTKTTFLYLLYCAY